MSLPHTKVSFTINNIPRRPTASLNIGFVTFMHIPNQPYTTIVDLVQLRYRDNITLYILNVFIVNMPGSETAFAVAPAAVATATAGREEFMQGVNGQGPDSRALPAGAAAAARLVEQEVESAGPGDGPDVDVATAASGTEGEDKKKSLPRRMMDKVAMKIGKVMKKA